MEPEKTSACLRTETWVSLYSRNRLLSVRLSQRKPTLNADLLNNRPKVTLKRNIGALIYLLYK